MASHYIEVVTTTQVGNRARIRFRCKECDLKATVTTSPANLAAGLVDAARHAPCDQIGQSQ